VTIRTASPQVFFRPFIPAMSFFHAEMLDKASRIGKLVE
jgi:hypothetical protein